MRFHFISFLLFLNSCNYSIKSSFEKKGYFKEINFNHIDHFPTFFSCDSMGGIDRERCFKEGVLRRIKENLLFESKFAKNFSFFLIGLSWLYLITIGTLY